MTASLHPCSSCSRHVLSTESACPFCGRTLSEEAVVFRSVPRGRLSRAALIALSTLAASPACGGDVKEVDGGDGDGDMSGDGDSPGDGDMSGDGDVTGDGDNPVAVYGAPAGGGFPNATGGRPGTGGGGEPNLGGMAGGEGGEEMGTGGFDRGTGGDQVAPVYGIAPGPID